MADINAQTMTAKQKHIDTRLACQAGRRTNGRRIEMANKLRQKASRRPRDSSGQPSNHGALAKKPLVLHNTAAAAMNIRPRQTPADAGSPEILGSPTLAESIGGKDSAVLAAAALLIC